MRPNWSWAVREAAAAGQQAHQIGDANQQIVVHVNDHALAVQRVHGIQEIIQLLEEGVGGGRRGTQGDVGAAGVDLVGGQGAVLRSGLSRRARKPTGASLLPVAWLLLRNTSLKA